MEQSLLHNAPPGGAGKAGGCLAAVAAGLAAGFFCGYGAVTAVTGGFDSSAAQFSLVDVADGSAELRDPVAKQVRVILQVSKIMFSVFTRFHIENSDL